MLPSFCVVVLLSSSTLNRGTNISINEHCVAGTFFRFSFEKYMSLNRSSIIEVFQLMSRGRIRIVDFWKLFAADLDQLISFNYSSWPIPTLKVDLQDVM